MNEENLFYYLGQILNVGIRKNEDNEVLLDAQVNLSRLSDEVKKKNEATKLLESEDPEE